MEFGKLNKVSVGVDSLKHTYLMRGPPALPPNRCGGSASVVTQLDSEICKLEQRRARSAMTSIHQRSSSPAVVRLYSASIPKLEQPRPIQTPSSKKRSKLFCARPQSQLEAIRVSRNIIAQATERAKLSSAPPPPRKASELVVDTRPHHIGVINSYEKRIQTSGIPEEGELEEPVPFPLNPFRASSPRDEPSNVYSPEGVDELVASCVPLLKKYEAEQLSHRHHQEQRGMSLPPRKPKEQTRQQRSPSPGSDIDEEGEGEGAIEGRKARLSPADLFIIPTSRKQAPLFTVPKKALPRSPRRGDVGNVLPSLEESEKAMRENHRSALPPTRNTLSARQRLVEVRSHLNWQKIVGENAGSHSQSQGAVFDATGTLVSEKSMAFGSGGSDNDVIRNHRKGIVKPVYNR